MLNGRDNEEEQARDVIVKFINLTLELNFRVPLDQRFNGGFE